jgi:hypothetical protein
MPTDSEAVPNPMAHKFRFGDIVTIRSSASWDIPRESYEIVRWLPPDDKGLQYQVKSLRDGHQRIVHETDFRKVGA